MSVSIFFCYAHEDEALLNKLKAQLRPLQRQGLIDVWHDRDISAGTEWEREIDKHLNTADIILLLVSPDFMDSEYCYGTEMKRAMERHQRGEARVIPVIVRPVYWQGILGHLQALPKDGKPISDLGWHDQDEAFNEVAVGIAGVVKKLTGQPSITLPAQHAPTLVTPGSSNAPPVLSTSAPVMRRPEALVPGNLLSSRYRIVRLIGKGGFGAVYEARDERFQRRVLAIKEMSDAQLTPKERVQALQDFRREAELLVDLKHPNLPEVSDFFEESGKAYLVMEYVEGKTLEQEQDAAGGPLNERLVMGWALQLCDVLYYLHTQPQPIIFRDMKPSNVMVTKSGQIKLIDFGIARVFKSTAAKDTTLLGSSGYAPLEQYGKGQSDARSDIYALGATLFDLLTKEVPADAPTRRINPQAFETPRQLNPAVSLAAESIVLKAMEQEPKDRYQTAAEMAQAIVASGLAGPTISGSLYSSPTMANTLATQLPGSPPSLASMRPAPPVTPPIPGSGAPGRPAMSAPPTVYPAAPPQVPPPAPLEPAQPAVAKASLAPHETPVQADPLQPSVVSGGSIPNQSPPTLPPPTRSPGSGLSSIFTDAGNALAKFFSRRGSKKQQETQLSLLAIARTTLEADDRALVGKVYTVLAGVSQNRPADFRGEPFTVSVQNPTEPLLFGILLHPSENIELMGARYQLLRYDPRNVGPQYISCPFRLKEPGQGYLVINFYRERQWLQTIRFEFEGVVQPTLSTTLRGR